MECGMGWSAGQDGADENEEDKEKDDGHGDDGDQRGKGERSDDDDEEYQFHSGSRRSEGEEFNSGTKSIMRGKRWL